VHYDLYNEINKHVCNVFIVCDRSFRVRVRLRLVLELSYIYRSTKFDKNFFNFFARLFNLFTFGPKSFFYIGEW